MSTGVHWSKEQMKKNQRTTAKAKAKSKAMKNRETSKKEVQNSEN